MSRLSSIEDGKRLGNQFARCQDENLVSSPMKFDAQIVDQLGAGFWGWDSNNRLESICAALILCGTRALRNQRMAEVTFVSAVSGADSASSRSWEGGTQYDSNHGVRYVRHKIFREVGCQLLSACVRSRLP